MLSAAVALAVGCVGEPPAAAPDPNTPAADGGEVHEAQELRPTQPLTQGEWQDLDFDQRRLFMSEVVMPAMRSLFLEFDSERFATFSCASCHGHGAGDGSFAMPSADLPALGGPPADMDDERVQRVGDFMRNAVKPKLAELLGDSELRCSTCHPSAS